MTTTVQGIDKFHDLVGQHIGYSDWHLIDQDKINRFADAEHRRPRSPALQASVMVRMFVGHAIERTD